MQNGAEATFRLFPVQERGIELVLARSSRTFTRHFHDQFGIGVVLSGAQRSASGRGQVEALTGDVITVNPGEVHDGSPVDCVSRSWAMLYLDPECVGQLAVDLSGGRHAQLELVDPVRTDRGAASMVRRLFRSLTTGPGSELIDPAEILIMLLDRLAMHRAPDMPSQAPSGFLQARQAIDDDPTRKHSLERLASISGLGRFQLIRLFTAETGLTPHAYATQRRLHTARKLLRQGLTPVQAAVEAGFADQSHMTRLFAKSYGVSPGAYRRAKKARRRA